MIPKRPYLLRAFYEWILDNGLTPHILVDATSSQVSVPRQYVKDGSIVLNVSPSATQGLMMRNDEVTFSARFGGVSFPIWLPMSCVMAIYARETQEGISFPPDEYAGVEEMPAPLSPAIVAVDSSDAASVYPEHEADDEPTPAKKPVKSRPNLRVVK